MQNSLYAIHHNNYYQNYMRLERNIHEQEQLRTLGLGYDPVLESSKTKVHN